MKSIKKVIIFGGPGTGVCIGSAINDAFKSEKTDLEFVGFLNDRDDVKTISGYPILGKFHEAPKFIDQGYLFLNTVYKIGGSEERIKRFMSFQIPDEQLAVFVHPKAYVAEKIFLSPGCVVMPNASISPGCQLGRCSLVMNHASIGHDCLIGDYCFFTSNCCLGSWLTIEEGVWVGMNATIRGKLKIGRYASIGIGAVVTKNIGDMELWIGNPAYFYKKVTDNINL